MLKRELQIFLTALMFYTRIPVPKNIDHNPELLNKATGYFPFVGWIVGGIAVLSFYIANELFNHSIAVVISFIVSILTTGAFHEDGFADMCDGFGGGWTKEKILDIMKDSRMGAYGTIGLICLFLLKFSVLNSVNYPSILILIFTGHVFSRLCPIIMVSTSNYVRENEDAKAKPLAKSITKNEIWKAVIFGVLPLALFNRPALLLSVLLPVLSTLYLRRYFIKWIGGYTGDCLGAIQQVAELCFYLNAFMLWKFI